MPLSREQLAASYQAHIYFAMPWATVAQLTGNTYKHFTRLKKALEDSAPRPLNTVEEDEVDPVNAAALFLSRPAR